jgi:phospholipid/cholesterol/gamma-HCH transport system substrate-binding protein
MTGYTRGYSLVRMGLLTVISGVAFSALFGFATNRSLTATHTRVYVNIESAEGLKKADAVLYQGVQVGEVKRLEFQESGDVLLRLTLTQRTPLTRSAQAALVATDIFGRKAVVLRAGAEGDRALLSGDTIDGIAPASMTASISELSEQAQRVLSDTTIGLVQDGLAELSRALREVAALSAASRALVNGEGFRVHKLISQATETMKSVEQLANGTGEATQASLFNLARLTARMDTVASSVMRITTQLEYGDGSVARLINDPALYERTTSALGSLEALLADVRRNPKRYINVKVF